MYNAMQRAALDALEVTVYRPIILDVPVSPLVAAIVHAARCSNVAELTTALGDPLPPDLKNAAVKKALWTRIRVLHRL